jgi:hypothetical protein
LQILALSLIFTPYLMFKSVKPRTTLISYLLFFAIALIFTACTRLDRISFDVKTPGVKSGVFIIKNDRGEMTFSANIKDGEVRLDSQVIEEHGYYMMHLSSDSPKTPQQSFEVYLVPGHYSITKSSPDSPIYPEIKSPSPEQQELSDYYTLLTQLKEKRTQALKNYNRQVNNYNTANFSNSGFKQVVNKSKQGELKVNDIEKDALTAFVKAHPGSITAAHIMTYIPVETDPVAFYNIYKSLSATTKNSDEGKDLGDKLSKLAKLVPGEIAPDIAGTNPEGKKFSKADYKKKIYLVEFWKAGNELSRLNHSPANILNMESTISNDRELGIISISLDSKRDWWTSAIKDDNLNWPQYSDLKGNESINAVNWGITRIPTYYLIDADWRILERDIFISEAPVVINQYLKHH